MSEREGRMRPTWTAIILAIALAAGLLAGRSLALGARPADAASTGRLARVVIDKDSFYNYDFNSQQALATNVDWPVGLLFWNNASVSGVKSIYQTAFPYSGSSQYELLDDGAGSIWDSDPGVKDIYCSSYNRYSRHMRLYADTDGQLYNVDWGYYVIGTAHSDYQECWFGTRYGWSETTEHLFADYAASRGYAVSYDALDFGNYEAPRLEGNHYWDNDGKATTVNVTGGAIVHDVKVAGLAAPASTTVGMPVPVQVTIQNSGNQPETASVSLTDNGTAVGSPQSISLPVGAGQTTSFTWQPTSTGAHTLVATASTGATDATPGDNVAQTTVAVTAPVHDVAVTAIAGPASVGPGQTAAISVTVADTGDFAETATVTLTATAGRVSPATQQTVALSRGGSATVPFTWTADATTAPGGSYTLTATAGVPDDANLSNDSQATTIRVSSATYVQALTLWSSGTAKSYQINGSVTIAEGGGVIPSATVKLRVTGPKTNVTLNATTGPNGIATFSRAVRYPGTYTVEVLSVAATGYTYDPSLNLVTQQTITVGS